MDVRYGSFVWDAGKEKMNIEKHGVDFKTAARAFLDDDRILIVDIEHSRAEDRFYCIGRADEDVLTVWYTHRPPLIRIIGAGRLRKGRKLYETERGI